jgi:hypothetical protein
MNTQNSIPQERKDLFDELLDSSLKEIVPGGVAAIKPFSEIYQQIVSFGNLSSYSMDSVFNACPRKYQIKKLQAAAGTTQRMNSPTFAFGHAVGAGVATYDETQNLRDAIWSAFLAWDIDLLDVETNKAGKLTGKSFHEAVWALYNYQTFYKEETSLADYDMVKAEAVLAVDFEDGHYYVGHIDELLQHRHTGHYLVKENKTTGMTAVDPCLYSNSDQALSYSIVVDMLGATSYDVLYTIYSSSRQEWVQFSFVKSANSKAEWLQDQLFLHQQRDDYATANFFPKRGASCFSYMRRCELYESCDFTAKTVFGKEFSELPRIQSIEQLGDIENVDYATTMSAIVARQQSKLSQKVSSTPATQSNIAFF